MMSSSQGSISLNTRGGQELYRASKSALNQLMRSFAARRVDDGQTLLLMDPGWVQTELGGAQALLTIEQSTRCRRHHRRPVGSAGSAVPQLPGAARALVGRTVSAATAILTSYAEMDSALIRPAGSSGKAFRRSTRPPGKFPSTRITTTTVSSDRSADSRLTNRSRWWRGRRGRRAPGGTSPGWPLDAELVPGDVFPQRTVDLGQGVVRSVMHGHRQIRRREGLDPNPTLEPNRRR